MFLELQVRFNPAEYDHSARRITLIQSPKWCLGKHLITRPDIPTTHSL